MKVVLAEDSAPTRRLLQATLERCGHTVTAVGDGQAALDAFGRDHPELFVLDWQMPVMDGLEACRRLRALDGGDRVFVLMVTSRDADGDLAIALDAGVDDYVMKPLTAEQLRPRQALAGRRRLSTLHVPAPAAAKNRKTKHHSMASSPRLSIGMCTLPLGAWPIK